MALWILSGTTWVSLYQKGKASLDLLEQEIVSGIGISWAICKSVIIHFYCHINSYVLQQGMWHSMAEASGSGGVQRTYM